MVDNRLITLVILNGMQSGILSLKTIMQDLDIDEETAREVLDEMVHRDIICDFDYEQDDMPLISSETFNHLFGKLSKDKQAQYKKIFCVYDENTKIDQSEPPYKEEKKELSDELKKDVLEYIKDYDRIGTALLQKHFGIGYSTASRIIDWLIEEGKIKHTCLPYDVIK